MAAASMTLAVLFLAGCSREQAEPSAQQEISEAVTSGPVTCYARYESLGDTKADIDGVGAFRWASDGSDCIAVYNGASTYSLTHVDPGGRFTATRYSGTTYPVYPYESASSGNNITYPDSYTIAGSMGYSSPTPMMAVDGGSGDLTFYHVGSLLRLTLENVPVGTKSIEVTLTRSSGYSTGTGTISNPGTSTSSVSITSGGKKVTFNLATATVMTSNGFMLNVPVPVGTYTGIQVVCKDTDGNVTAGWNDITSHTLARAQGSRITASAPYTFAGLEIAPSNLKYNGTTFVLPEGETWKNNSYNSKYGLTDGSYYFNWVHLQPFSSITIRPGNIYEYPDGPQSIDNLGEIVNTLGGWRVPTASEFRSIVGTQRNGSRVNGTAGCRYALIQLTGVTDYFSTEPYGLLVLPDDIILTGMDRTFVWNTDTSIASDNRDVSETQLNEYLDKGCMFLPAAGHLYDGGYWSSSTAYYWGADAINNGAEGSYFLRFGNWGITKADDPALYPSNYYYPVRLVRNPQ